VGSDQEQATHVGWEEAVKTDDPQKANARYKHWIGEIKAAEKVFADYNKRAKKIIKTYRDDRKRGDDSYDDSKNSTHKMNMLWSNVETLKPALYSRTPTPNASRRFLDRDPVSRTAAQIMERNLVTAIELSDVDYVFKRVRDDFLLVGRGTDWVRFDPTMGQQTMREPVTSIDLGSRKVYRPFKGGEEIAADRVQKDEDGLEYYESDPEEQILAYGLAVDHVVWSDFLHEPVNDWSKVTWAAKRVLMKRMKLVKQFGEKIGREISLHKTFNGDNADPDSSQTKKKGDCAEVWEIWCKESRKVYWISEGYDKAPLKEEDDPLGLSSFWPFPRPMFATTTTDSLIPIPDFAMYQDQSDQVDRITDRIRLLIQALRVVGLYNGESAELSSLLGEANENEMIPVANWMAFAQGGGMKGNIDWLPIEQIQTVLTGLFSSRSQLKQDMYEITGISDIIRGATAPSETATAQQLKANFGNLRLQDRQADMSRFAKGTLMVMAEIQCEHYSPEALIEMSGVADMEEFRVEPLTAQQQQDPAAVAAYQQKTQESQSKLMQAVQLIKNDKMRTFRIDLETDATVAQDQEKEKAARIEFLGAVAPFIEKATQVGQLAPDMVPLLLKMLEFGVRGFRAGRSLEGAIEETIKIAEQMQEAAKAAPPQAPPPDPAAEAMAAKLSAETQKIQQELQRAQAEYQAKAADAQAKSVAFAQESAAKAAAAESSMQKEQLKFEREMMKLTEDIAFRREENRMKIAELESSIELNKLKMHETTEAGALKAIQDMMPEKKAEENFDPNARAKADSEYAELEAKRHEAAFKREKAERALAELRKRDGALDGISKALTGNGESMDDVLGLTGTDAKPAAPAKKSVSFLRDENGMLTGADVEG